MVLNLDRLALLLSYNTTVETIHLINKIIDCIFFNFFFFYLHFQLPKHRRKYYTLSSRRRVHVRIFLGKDLTADCREIFIHIISFCLFSGARTATTYVPTYEHEVHIIQIQHDNFNEEFNEGEPQQRALGLYTRYII